MGDRESRTQKELANARIVHADVLDGRFLIISFSNGAAAKISLDRVKELALSAALEIVYSDEEDFNGIANGN